MSKIDEKIHDAANRFADTHHLLLGSNNKTAYNSFVAGANFALSHQWVSVEDELPEDDEDVLALATTIKNQKVGLALCFKDSNGTVKWVSDDINTDYIRFWLPIPPLPEARKEDMV